MTPYVFRAKTIEVLDADSVRMDIDCGFSITYRTIVRLFGCNAAELGTPGGDAARDFLTAMLPVGCPVLLASEKPDKFGGRILAVVQLAGGTDVAQLLIEQGWAAPWNGRGVKPVPPWPREVAG